MVGAVEAARRSVGRLDRSGSGGGRPARARRPPCAPAGRGRYPSGRWCCAQLRETQQVPTAGAEKRSPGADDRDLGHAFPLVGRAFPRLGRALGLPRGLGPTLSSSQRSTSTSAVMASPVGPPPGLRRADLRDKWRAPTERGAGTQKGEGGVVAEDRGRARAIDLGPVNPRRRTRRPGPRSGCWPRSPGPATTVPRPAPGRRGRSARATVELFARPTTCDRRPGYLGVAFWRADERTATSRSARRHAAFGPRGWLPRALRRGVRLRPRRPPGD